MVTPTFVFIRDTLKRFFERFEQNGLTIQSFRADCGSCSEEIVEEIETQQILLYPRKPLQFALAASLYRGWKTEKSMALSSSELYSC